MRAGGDLIGTAVPADAPFVWSNHSTCVADSRLSAALDAEPAPELGGEVVLTVLGVVFWELVTRCAC